MKVGYLKEYGFGLNYEIRSQLLANEKLDKTYVDSSDSRDEYRKMLMQLSPFDALYIWSVDELGTERNEILEQWRIITGDIQAKVNVLSCPILNSNDGDITLEEKLIRDVLLGILAGQTEIINKKVEKIGATAHEI